MQHIYVVELCVMPRVISSYTGKAEGAWKFGLGECLLCVIRWAISFVVFYTFMNLKNSWVGQLCFLLVGWVVHSNKIHSPWISNSVPLTNTRHVCTYYNEFIMLIPNMVVEFNNSLIC